MSYSNLTSGSRGEDVRRLQETLMNAGYDVGSTGADGVYGAKTQAAVRQYQQDHGLTVDGIAGEKTQTSLYSGATNGSAVPEAAPVQQTKTASPVSRPVAAYNPDSDAAYQQAIAALTRASQNAPVYQASYDGQLMDIYNQIVNRPKFQYDINDDMLYQQYAQQYARQGRLAMEDTIGQAAALTGGYGSSYGQAVGQQQYDAYLQRLNDVIPELYGMAYGQYQDEGNALMQQYQMLGAMADDEYARYQDAYNRWANERDYALGQVNDAYQRGYNNYWQSVEQQNADREYQIALDKWQYSVQQDEEAKAAKGSSGGSGGVPYAEVPAFDYKEQQFYDYYLNLLNNKSKSHAVTYLNNAVRNGIISQDAANRMMALSPDPTPYSGNGSVFDSVADWVEKYGEDAAEDYIGEHFNDLGYSSKSAAVSGWKNYQLESGAAEGDGSVKARTEVKKVGSAQGEAIIWNGRTYRISNDGLASLLNDINGANLSEAEINRIVGNLKSVGINVG